MNSAPLPEFQLKFFLNYLTASAAHSGHTTSSCAHIPPGICTAEGALEWQNFPSHYIHVTYVSHQFENLSLFGPFNVFALELELMFSLWAGVP